VKDPCHQVACPSCGRPHIQVVKRTGCLVFHYDRRDKHLRQPCPGSGTRYEPRSAIMP
jgi:hypothetical protein